MPATRAAIVHRCRMVRFVGAILAVFSIWLRPTDASGQVVTPTGGSMSAYAITTHQIVSFSVYNNTGSSQVFTLTCLPTGQVTSCTGRPNIFIPSGQTMPVVDTFATSSVGSGHIYLTAGTSMGSYTVTVSSGTPSVSVTPHGGWALPIVPQYTSGYRQTFTIKNTGTIATWYAIHCSGATNVTCTQIDHYGTTTDSVTLAAGASKTDTAYYNVIGGGTGVLSLVAAGDAISDSGYYSVTVAGQSYSSNLTTAADGIMYAHATPPFGAMGTTHALTLAYNSAAAHPVVLVSLDVTGTTSPSPTLYELQVLKGGSALTLMNGGTAVYDSATGGVPNRITAAVDAKTNGLGTGSYAVSLILTITYPSSTQVDTLPARLLVNDQTWSEFGAAVGIAGVGRLFSVAGDYGRTLVDGSGAAEFFGRTCAGCAFTSPAGESGTLVAYDSATTDTLYRLTALDGSITDFNRQGRMIRHRPLASLNPDVLLTWSDTLLVKLADSSGRGDSLAYSHGRLTSIIDFAGRSTIVTVDSTATGNHLRKVVDPDGGKDSLIYNSSNLLTELNSRTGGAWNYGYNVLYQGDTIRAPGDTDYTGTYVRPTTTVVTAAQVSWQSGTVGTSAGTAKKALRPDTVYTATTDPLGNVTKVQTDRFGLPTKTIDALGEATTIGRDTLGNPIWEHDPTGHASTASYATYLLKMSYDSTIGDSVTYTYDSHNRIETVQGGVRMDYFYRPDTLAPAGTLTLIYSGDTAAIGATPKGGVIVDSLFLDAFGRDTLVVDGLGHRTRSTYDAAGSGGNLHQTIDALGRTTTYHYGSYGLPDTTTVASGSKQSVKYDTLSRPSTVTNRLGYSTRYAYGALGLTRVTDPKGQAYKFDLNAWGLVRAQHDLGDTTTADSMKYDAAGETRTVKTRRGDTITLAYDALGRLTSRSFSDSTPGETFSYGIVAGGSWAVAASTSARDSMVYDAAGHLLYSSQHLPGDTTRTMSYHYDASGRLYLRVASPVADTFHLAYDPSLGGVDTLCAVGTCEAVVRDSELKPLQFTYNTQGSGKWSHVVRYDSLHQTTADTFSVAQLQSDFGTYWTYDSIGLLTGANDGAGGNRGTFYHDALGELIEACKNTFLGCPNEYGQGWPIPAYRFDSAGNRVDTIAHPTIAAGNRATRFKNYGITYDANGDVTQMAGLGTSGIWTSTDTTTFQWNAAGQLTRVEHWPASGSHRVVKFRYDALGRRVAKTVNGTTTFFVYDGDQVEMDVDSATRTMEVAYGFDGGLYAMRTPSDTLVAITAPSNGTVLGLARANGGAERKQYNVLTVPWLQATTDTGLAVRFRMAGQEYDQETGLYHMGARYYNPTIGRWISEDPAGIVGGTNLYSYAANDPIDNTDPTGSYTCDRSGGPKSGILHCHWTEQDCASNSGVTFVQCGIYILIEFCENIGGIWTGSECDFVTWDNSSLQSDPLGASDDGQQSKIVTCTGTATFTAVGGNQATANGALYSQYPQLSGGSIQGGTFGSVAVQNGFLGLSRRQLRMYGTQISVTPGNQALIAKLGGPTGPLSVSDIGDANVQVTPGVAFDIYRFPTIAAAKQFGRQVLGVTISFPSNSGASCPDGFERTP